MLKYREEFILYLFFDKKMGERWEDDIFSFIFFSWKKWKLILINELYSTFSGNWEIILFYRIYFLEIDITNEEEI